ncbi:MAG TPA: hypothetical protein VE974_06055 [Thermoanaerobaculia bacterium]|nr:hypothetical protein [Thermoanaerobaculia bacterium]
MNEVLPLILGAVERTEDKRDINLGAVQAPVTRPETHFSDVSNLPTYYQSHQPACGAHAGTWFKVRKDSRDTAAPANYTPKFTWNDIKTFDGYALEVGTDMRSIFKSLKNTGACDYPLLPNTVEQSVEAYGRTPLTAEMRQNASTKKIASYAFLTDLSFDAVCDAVYQNKEVILLIKCDSGFFRNTTPTFSQPLSGHFVVAYDRYDKDYIWVKDSTESDPQFSVKKIHRRYFQPQFIREGGTAINLPPLVVNIATNRNALIRELIRLYTLLLPFAPKK